jgi:serine/threonine-protein kinase SRPK3
MSHFKAPETAEVYREDGEAHESGVPKYMVWPVRLRVPSFSSPPPHACLIDFGEAFTANDKPETLHTPMALRPPEVLFEDTWDYRVDLWSVGCTVR